MSISRQAAIDAINNHFGFNVEEEYGSAVQEVINGLPSVQQWIPCSERMPEEHEWVGTKQFGTTISDEVYVTFENPDGVRFTEHLCLQNGKLNDHDQLMIDAFYEGAVPIAWMPLPEPWGGEKDG